MAQGVVTDFFTTKKRTDPFQPSKRRKVQRGTTVDVEQLKSVADLLSLKTEKSTKSAGFTLKQNSEGFETVTVQNVLLKTVEPVGKSKVTKKTNAPANTQRRTSSRNKTRTQKSVKHGPMDKILAAKGKNDKNSPFPEPDEDSKPVFPDKSNAEQVTSVLDDHNQALPKSLPGTPTKRSKQNSDAPIRRKRRKPALSEVEQQEEPTKEPIEKEVSKPERTTESKQTGRVSSSKAKSKASVKKSLDKTFQKYENKQQNSESVVAKESLPSQEVSAPVDSTTTSKRTSRSKPKPVIKPSDGRHVSKVCGKSDESDKAKVELVQGSPSEQNVSSSGRSRERGGKTSRSSALGDRIRASMQEQKSPVKQQEDSAAASSIGNKGKLTPSMVRDRLSKSGKLAELQARLSQMKELADQAKKDAKPTVTKKAKTKPVVEKKEEKPTSVPAYQKYHSLASPAPPSLTLPFKYKGLEQMFSSMDTVVSLLHNRKEVCTFPKLKDAVQEMCRKAFDLRNLGQIKTVYPTGFFLSHEKELIKQRKTTNQSTSADTGYQLTVQPNLDSDGTTSTAHDSSEIGTQAMQGATNSLQKKFTPSMLIARRSLFHSGLIDIVKEHHKNFLAKLDRPLTVPDEKLTRWHPKFPLDSIPEVEPSTLPEPPVVKTYSNAKDVLNKARNMMTPRVVKALETVAKNSEMLKSAKLKSSNTSATLSKLAASMKDQGSSGQGSKEQGSGLKGVNQSLLDRIRAKEAQKQVEAMTRDPELEKRICRLERLPELCRILRVYFLAEKKGALVYDDIVKKLSDSTRFTLGKAEMEAHMNLMIEVLPEWLTVHNIRREKYIKMNKSQDMNKISAKVTKLWKESK